MCIEINSYFDDVEITLNLEYTLILKSKLDSNIELNKKEQEYLVYLENYNNAIIEKKKSAIIALKKEDSEAIEDIEDSEAIEDIEDSEDIEDIEDIEAIEDIEDIEAIEDIEDSEDIEDIEDSEANKILNNVYIKLRKNRDNIPNSLIIKKFLIGDILEFVYFFKNLALTFSGICIAMTKKAFILPDVSLILRNIIVKTGVEVVISYFYNRAYKMTFLDYKRKFYTFNKNKLYFVRERLNRESRID